MKLQQQQQMSKVRILSQAKSVWPRKTKSRVCANPLKGPTGAKQSTSIAFAAEEKKKNCQVLKKGPTVTREKQRPEDRCDGVAGLPQDVRVQASSAQRSCWGPMFALDVIINDDDRSPFRSGSVVDPSRVCQGLRFGPVQLDVFPPGWFSLNLCQIGDRSVPPV